MKKKITKQQGNSVTATAIQAKSLMSERINEVLDQKTTKAISSRVKGSTLKMAKHIDAKVKGSKLVMDKGTEVTRIDSEWGQMMDLTLITKKEGNHIMAMVRANYGGEITESGWCYVHDIMTREEMALEVMLTCWVNSEVIGAGSK